MCWLLGSVQRYTSGIIVYAVASLTHHPFTLKAHTHKFTDPSGSNSKTYVVLQLKKQIADLKKITKVKRLVVWNKWETRAKWMKSHDTNWNINNRTSMLWLMASLVWYLFFLNWWEPTENINHMKMFSIPGTPTIQTTTVATIWHWWRHHY